MNIKRTTKPKDQKKLFDDESPENTVNEVMKGFKSACISSKDLFDTKLNPTLRLDADFALKLADKLQKQNKKDIVGDKIESD